MSAEQILLAFEKKITIHSKAMKFSEFGKVLNELKAIREQQNQTS